MVESQQEIHKTVEEIEAIVDQLEQVNNWIGEYNLQLNNMKQYVTEIDTEDAARKIETTNRLQLAKISFDIVVC